MQAAKKRSKSNTRKRVPNSNSKSLAEWQKLIKFLDGCSARDFLFRGVSSTDHNLLPKSGRIRKYSEVKEQEIFEQFKRQSATLISDYSPRSDFEWLAVAQHHGLPTRLLDWTSNPLIAGYFAVSGPADEAENDAKIFAFKRTNAIRHITNLGDPAHQNPFAVAGDCVVSPPWMISRIIAQRGLFTIHPYPNKPFSPSGLKSHTIPREHCDYIKERLSQFGFDNSSIMPGLDGIGSTLSGIYQASG